MRNVPGTILLAVTLAVPAFCDCAPLKLRHIVIQDGTPGLSETSFAAQPRVVYRLGSKYARIEEQLDTTNRIHELIVISEPDSWIANRADGTGRHLVDDSAHQAVVFPVVPKGMFPSLPDELRSLEVGCEVEFFKEHGSQSKRLNTSDGPMVQQALGVGTWKFVLLSDTVTTRPRLLFLFEGNEIRFVLKYVVYEDLSRPDMSLFARPVGIRFAENRPSN
jgi:hypothetical protein